MIDDSFIAGAIPEKADRFPLDAIEVSDLTLTRGDALAMEDMNDLRSRAREPPDTAAPMK